MKENNIKDTKKNKFLVPVLSFIVLILFFFLGYIIGRSGFNVVWESGDVNYTIKGTLYPEESEINFDIFWDVWELVETKYVEKAVNSEEMFYGAAKGMVNALGDPATKFYTPSETASYEFERSGGLEGIGVELGYMNEGVIVKRIFDNSPAKDSEIAVGDTIIKVDGEDVSGIEIYEVAKKIRGEKGTVVKITVLRNDEELEIDITRDQVYIESIDWEQLENGIVQINIRRFTESDFSSFTMLWDQVINEIIEKNPKGIIIDLRGNGGGFLDGAVYLAGEFVDKGKVILYVENREGDQKPYKVNRNGKLKDVPIILIVDSETASSSEIFAGALQYYERVTIIGEDTFGKGTAQDVVKPSSWGGASMHITTQKWLLPDKRWINKDDPIKPDIQVEVSIEEIRSGEDPQMEKAKLEIEKEM